MTAYLLTPQQHAQIVDALNRVDAVNRGMVTTNAHKYAARDETTEALAMLKAMKPQTPAAWVVDGGKKNSMLLPTFVYELELEVPKIMCKPLYTLGDTA